MNQKYWTLARYGWPGLLHAERLHVLYPDLFCHVFSLLLLLQFLHGWSIMAFAFLDFRLLLYIQVLFSVRLGDRLVHRAAFFSSFHFFLSFFSFFFFLSFFHILFLAILPVHTHGRNVATLSLGTYFLQIMHDFGYNMVVFLASSVVLTQWSILFSCTDGLLQLASPACASNPVRSSANVSITASTRAG